jgi:hypothetical protein
MNTQDKANQEATQTSSVNNLPTQKEEPKEVPKPMVTMFGKKKRNPDQTEPSGPTKFKFDEGFVDTPLRPQLPPYNY